jgi:hypothetical protein
MKEPHTRTDTLLPHNLLIYLPTNLAKHTYFTHTYQNKKQMTILKYTYDATETKKPKVIK